MAFMMNLPKVSLLGPSRNFPLNCSVTEEAQNNGRYPNSLPFDLLQLPAAGIKINRQSHYGNPTKGDIACTASAGLFLAKGEI